MRVLMTAAIFVCAFALSVPAQTPECVDINTAPSEQLQRIIHIGPERAAQIIELRRVRRFQAVDQLTRVRGIAATRLADIKQQGLACVRLARLNYGPRPRTHIVTLTTV
jgi:DNA uptake protein ComE-like DNA-binding protein